MPIAMGKEAHPGTLNRGRIIGSSRIPTAFIKFVPLNTSEATKKGNKEGKTTLSHKSIPFNAELTAVFENIINDTIKTIHTIGTTSDFNMELSSLYFK